MSTHIRNILLLLASALFVFALSKPFGTLPALGKLLSPATGFWRQALPAQEQATTETLMLEGMTKPVQISYDERAVPHIFAQNAADAYFAQGYLTARERLWQMDMTTRHAAGRLAEVLGEELVDTDRQQRRLGLLPAAEETVKAWEKSGDFPLLEAFTAGINAYIAQLSPRDYPIEYKLMSFAPEKWTPLHSALVIKSMEQTLCFGNNDLQATNALKWLGRDSFDLIYPEYNPGESPVIPVGTAFAKYDPPPAHYGSIPALREMLPPRLLPQPPEFIGSNNWAVSGAKTASGQPILCNDPHLPLKLPSIWYELEIQTPEMKVHGVSLPGLPGIIIGFNEYIAWGVTNVGQDVLDWYAIQWADDDKEFYLLDGEKKPVRKVVEVIRVKGRKEPLRDTVKYTVWGPVVYEEPDEHYADLAMQWLALIPPPPDQLSVFLHINSARNYQDFKQALQSYQSPPQNFAFASADGDIALIIAGKFPIRRHEQGRFVQDGSQSKNAWQGFIPFVEQPQVLNPQRGFISSANQRSTDLSYPYYYTGRFADYRGRFINRSLAKMQNITAEDMMALQCSNYSLQAEENLPALLRHLDSTSLTPLQQSMLDSLRKWDYRFEAELKAPALYEKWWQNFYELSWDEWHTLRDSMPVLMPEGWRTIALLDSLPQAGFWDIQSTPEREDAAAVVLSAFRQMSEELGEDFASPDFNWGSYRKLDISHMAKLPAFSRKGLSAGGHPTAPKAIREGFGPSWRMIVETGTSPKARCVYPGGQSGNPGSPHYDDFLPLWLDDRYFKVQLAASPE